MYAKNLQGSSQEIKRNNVKGTRQQTTQVI